MTRETGRYDCQNCAGPGFQKPEWGACHAHHAAVCTGAACGPCAVDVEAGMSTTHSSAKETTVREQSLRTRDTAQSMGMPVVMLLQWAKLVGTEGTGSVASWAA